MSCCFKSSISLLWVLELLFQVKYFFVVGVGVVVSSQVFLCCGCWSWLFQVKYFFVLGVGVVVSSQVLLCCECWSCCFKYFFVVSVGVVVSVKYLFVVGVGVVVPVKYLFVLGVGVVVSSQVFSCCECWSCCFKSSISLFHSSEKWTPQITNNQSTWSTCIKDSQSKSAQ